MWSTCVHFETSTQLNRQCSHSRRTTLFEWRRTSTFTSLKVGAFSNNLFCLENWRSECQCCIDCVESSLLLIEIASLSSLIKIFVAQWTSNFSQCSQSFLHFCSGSCESAPSLSVNDCLFSVISLCFPSLRSARTVISRRWSAYFYYYMPVWSLRESATATSGSSWWTCTKYWLTHYYWEEGEVSCQNITGVHFLPYLINTTATANQYQLICKPNLPIYFEFMVTLFCGIFSFLVEKALYYAFLLLFQV